MELASSFIILLLLTGGSASWLHELEEDPDFNETDEEMSGGRASGLHELEEDPDFNEDDEEMSGGNQPPPPVPEKPFFIFLPGDGTYYAFLLVAPSVNSSQQTVRRNMNLIMAQAERVMKDVSWRGSNRVRGQTEPDGGSASGFPEYEEDPAFYEDYEEMSGGSASGSLKIEKVPVSVSLSHFVLNDIKAMSFVKMDVGNSDFPEDGPIRYDKCSYQDVLNHLNLSKHSDLFRMSRPVKNHTTATEVKLVMAISAILDVRETDQTFIAYIWIHMVWKNEFIHWNPGRFCQIKHVLVPTNVLWKPDIVIEEMIEKDKAPPSEFLKIRSNGDVEYRNDLVVLSTCKMQVYKFPFDIQSCTISFKSLMHSDEELYFFFSNTTMVTELSRQVMQTQYEWLFIKMTVTSKTDSLSIDSNQTSVIHTISMKRRSLLYIANFLMPVLFFLCLDLSSFLISDSGGEKLSFKVTVLLAVTVMQLILNEILPCSSERIPLIAVYCIGIFSLMMLSLLETILVMHLMEKDAASAQDNDINRDHKLMKHKLSKSSIHHCFKEIYGNCAAVSDEQADETPSVVKEDSRSQLMEVSLALGKVSDELEQIEKSMTALSEGKEEKKQGDWTRVAKKINKVFIIFYLTAVSVFLVVIFTLWCLPDEEE